jgi:hypothetical protein
MIRTLFASPGPDSKRRRLYMFYVDLQSCIADLKLEIKSDFGWDSDQISIFFNYTELNNHEWLRKIENFDHEEDVLIVLMNSIRPQNKLPLYLKSKMDDISLEDVKFFNSNKDEAINLAGEEQKFEYPEYVDWTAELVEINATVWAAKEDLKLNLENKEALDLLSDAEKEYYQLWKSFEEAAKTAVQTIVETQATPLNLFNLYGDGGRKYTSAGLFIRHWDEWLYHRKYRLDKDQSRKMASHDIKAFSLLRHQFKNLIIPLCWLVDYRGEVFQVQNISPITINTLVYGSDTHGLNYEKKDFTAEEIARQISSKLNLKPHIFKELFAVNSKINEYEIFLPYSVQIHWGLGKQESSNYYIINPGALFCCDNILSNDADYTPKMLVRQLRPEWMINNHDDEFVEGYVKQTWIKPTPWCSCGEYIVDFEYYYYEKRNLDKKRTLLTQLYWWPNCFFEVNSEIKAGLATEEHPLAIKYPWHKFEKRELHESKRGEFWLDELTGTVVAVPPMK